jgi:hypothetical protein
MLLRVMFGEWTSRLPVVEKILGRNEAIRFEQPADPDNLTDRLRLLLPNPSQDKEDRPSFKPPQEIQDTLGVLR